jgi:hypothetical protein
MAYGDCQEEEGKNAKDAGDSMLATDASVVYKRHPSKHRPGVQRHP